MLEAETQGNQTKDKRGFAEYNDLDTSVLKIVKDDPFLSINGIKKVIRNNSVNWYPSWWEIFSILRKNRLLTKKARFKYCRGYF